MPIKGILKSGVPVKIWSDISTVESEALSQLKNVASLPFVFRHVAVMPDVHVGKGATIGSVIATKGAVIPAAVGVDIGCGMMALRTDLDKNLVLDNLSKLRQSIERRIPVGHNGNKNILPSVQHYDLWKDWKNVSFGDNDLFQKAVSQCGSLGGGNHFIEICLDSEDKVWIMLHSGSRNVGKTLADRHINEAKGLMKTMLISLPDSDLAYFPEGTKNFDSYLHDVSWCQEYAMRNREEMMGRIIAAIEFDLLDKQKFGIDMVTNCHHNYIEREHHFGENVLVTRKGAVRARVGDYGIIPGSMGTKSYIVRGLGNTESFMSCSHGAGRKMSRSKAREVFTQEDVFTQTAGVECRKDMGIVDELPAAYKSIDEVMENQSDLVQTVAILKQVLCIKG